MNFIMKKKKNSLYDIIKETVECFNMRLVNLGNVINFPKLYYESILPQNATTGPSQSQFQKIQSLKNRSD